MSRKFMGRRLAVAFLLVLLVGSFFVGLAFAAISSCQGYWGAVSTSTRKLYANSGTAMIGQGFNASTTGYLTNITVEIRRYGSITGIIHMRFEGAADAADHPNGTVLATSPTTFFETDISDSAWGNFTFNFDGTVQLVANSSYGFTIYLSDVSGGDGASNYFGFHYDSGISDYDVGRHWSGGADWVTGSGCMKYEVFISDTAYGVEDGGDNADGTSDTDATISSLMWWFIYLIVMLAPAWFLGIFCKMGKWGFVLGLAIGTGIGYAFLTGFPMWLLILVAVGEAGLVYSTVSREG